LLEDLNLTVFIGPSG